MNLFTVWYRRHFRLDIDDLCIRYGQPVESESRFLYKIWSKIKSPSGGKIRKKSSKLKAAKRFDKRNLYTIDIADIAEVRKGYSTDAFNALEKRIKKFESGESTKKLNFPKVSAGANAINIVYGRM